MRWFVVSKMDFYLGTEVTLTFKNVLELSLKQNDAKVHFTKALVSVDRY